MKKIKFRFLIILLIGCFLSYEVIGILASYRTEPEISEEVKESFQVEDLYGQGEGPDRAVLVEDNEDALLLRLAMIAGAKDSIILSTFDIKTDEGGLDVISALFDAAMRGVSVDIFTDGSTKIGGIERDAYFQALLSFSNVRIIVYNPVNLLKPWNLMGRMHDKYLIVDEDAYLLGGRNTYSSFLGDYDGSKNYDREILIYNTGSGDSSLYDVLDYYEEITSLDCCRIYQGGQKYAKKSSSEKAQEELKDRYLELEEENPFLTEELDYTALTKETGEVTLLFNPTTTAAKEPVVFYELMQIAQSATEEVCIHMPYVICNDWMQEELAKIGEKGMLLFNSAANNGNSFAALDYMRHKQDLIDTGMTIYEYAGGVSYHGKSMTVDDELAIIGSFNMDMRSTYLDTEVMAVIDSKEITADLEDAFVRYEDDAALVEDADSYAYIPETVTMEDPGPWRMFCHTCFGWLLDELRFLI